MQSAIKMITPIACRRLNIFTPKLDWPDARGRSGVSLTRQLFAIITTFFCYRSRRGGRLATDWTRILAVANFLNASSTWVVSLIWAQERRGAGDVFVQAEIFIFLCFRGWLCEATRLLSWWGCFHGVVKKRQQAGKTTPLVLNFCIYLFKSPNFMNLARYEMCFQFSVF